MSEIIIDQVVTIWKRRQASRGVHPDAATRDPDISAQDVLATLAGNYPLHQIAAVIEAFLYQVVEAYDEGSLSYSIRGDKGIYMKTRAGLCASLVGETEGLEISPRLLAEIIRTFPAPEWYQTVRSLIETRLGKTDVLNSLAAALNSRRRGQIYSAAAGLKLYEGYARPHTDRDLVDLEHAVHRITAQLNAFIGSKCFPNTGLRLLKEGQRYIQRWRSS